MSSVTRALARLLVGSLAVVLLAVNTGCTDTVTFSRNNREAGIIAYNEARYTDSAGSFRAALKQDPRDYQSHYWLGQSLLQMGQPQSASVAFRSCLDTRTVTLAGKEDESIQGKALEGLAQCIVKSDDTDVEVNKIEQIARGASGAKAAQEFFLLGKVYRHRGLPDMALDYYNRACLQDNRNFTYLKEYGLYLEQLQQNANAEQTLRQAYALNSNDAEVNAGLQRLGIVPGLALKSKGSLAKPPLPKGPIPEPDWQKVKEGLGWQGDSKEQPAATPTPTNTAATPRD
jgi:tetratricopeptide (TPR) repeat protein